MIVLDIYFISFKAFLKINFLNMILICIYLLKSQ